MRKWAAPLLLVLVAAAWRVTLFGGVRVIDHIEMSRHAHKIVDGSYRPVAHHYPLRILFLLPMAGAQSALGVTDAAAAAFPLLCSLGLMILAYAAGRRAAGTWAGMAAGGIVALLPLDAILATQPYPDVAAALFSSAAGFWILLGSRRSGALFGAGLLAGAAYLMKESGAFVLALPVVLAIVRRDRRLALWTVAGFLLVLAAEMTLWGIWTGDPLIRFRAAAAQRSFWGVYYPDAGSVAARLTYEFPAMMFLPVVPEWAHFAFFFWMAAAAFWILRRDELGRGLALWIGLVFALILVFPLSLLPYRPALLAYARHLYPLIVPAAVAIGVAVARAPRRWIAPLSIHAAAALAAALWVHHYQERWMDGSREALASASAPSPRRLYVDKIGAGLFEYRLGFPTSPEILRHEYLQPADIQEGVLIDNPQWIDSGQVPPAWRGADPPGWEVVWQQSYPRRRSLRQWLRGEDPGSFTLRVIRIREAPK